MPKNSSNEPVNDVIPDNLKTRLMSQIYFFTVLGLVIVDVKTSIIISSENSVGVIGAGSGISSIAPDYFSFCREFLAYALNNTVLVSHGFLW